MNREVITIFEDTQIKMELTGSKLDSKEYIHIQKYSNGGMSSGIIDPGFWLNIALPLLIERFNRLS